MITMEYNLTMDNDSGYVSHNQESNFDSSSENMYHVRSSTYDLYINEDALLEKPVVNHVQNNSKHLEFDSVINSSQDSVKTDFSGFEDSDSSFVIPAVQPIVYHGSDCKENVNIPEETSKSVPFATKSVLANVTNTYDQNISQPVMKNTLSNKENIPPVETPKKRYHNLITSEISPDLFSEEEETTSVQPTKKKSPMKKETPKNHCIKDTKLLRNVQSSLTGVHPPPSVTIIQMDVAEMLEKIKENNNLFWNVSSTMTETTKSLLLNDTSECVDRKWPEILKARYHGLHYNRTKVSEDFEHLCLKYAERYVGAETQSSCRVFESNPPSSQKRKMIKSRWNVKSPGRRLSHLARRRITFSSANLQANSSSAILGSRARQILVDARKLSLLKKSPKKSPRKTPSKSPFKLRKNTPSSSAKKKLAMRFREMSGEFENIASTSSQDHSLLSFERSLFSNNKDAGRSIEKKSTKRALFLSPLKHSPKKSPLKMCTLDRKRKRTDSENSNPSKFHRSFSLDARSSKPESNHLMNRTLSESFASKSEELTDQHKKKLQWAVYESLRLQNITHTHPQYKVFASVLARVTRKFLPNLRFEGRTTEKMFRIARHHSYAVVKGKTVDEIVNEYLKNRMKNQKPQGYVGIEEFNKAKNESIANKENVQEKVNIMESIEKRREHAGNKSRVFSQNRIDQIKKVISFEEKET